MGGWLDHAAEALWRADEQAATSIWAATLSTLPEQPVDGAVGEALTRRRARE
jgi:hypothetical protein